MLHSSAFSHPSTGHVSRHKVQRVHSTAAVSRHVPRRPSGYALEHDGHRIRIRPIAFWIVVGTLVIMAAWSVATGTYFAFRKDVLSSLIHRQTQMEFAYEDRIAELRAQIDRITGRQLLDQQQFEQKLKDLVQRQALLDRQGEELDGDSAVTTPSHGHARAARKSKRIPMHDSALTPVPSEREASLAAGPWPPRAMALASPVQSDGVEATLDRVSTSLDRVAQRQAAAATRLQEHVERKAERMRDAIDGLGVDIAKIPARRGIGGPFVPLKLPEPHAGAFEHTLYRIDVARAHIDRYRQALLSIPVRKPLGSLDVTSPFGVRSDPFLGRPEMHTGLDLRGQLGQPVHATADGTVKIAGRDGGYGNLVEIDHGDGLATRYGHLSEIDVRLGQRVRVGQIIGKIGSTGRSTGPHLHYETRINGEPVNPEKFLQAGIKLSKAGVELSKL